jgi:Protein of unknown function (DUF1236)
MQHLSCAFICVALLTAAPVLAQSSAPPGEAVHVANPPLSAEKQLEIKTSITRYSRALKPGQDLPRISDKLTVGATVPTAVQLITLPQDTVTEVPTTTSYRFVLMGSSIAVVEPETRKVLQIIE